MKKIYLAGPMRGIKDFNFNAFHAAAAQLRAAGHMVFNPAEIDEAIYGPRFAISETGDASELPKQFEFREALALNLDFIVRRATAIAILPGWETSNGVRAELAAARAVGLEEIYLP